MRFPLVDRLRSWLAPKAPAMPKSLARQTRLTVAAQLAARNYAAAQGGRLLDGWSTTGSSANSDISASLDALRARSRQLARDNDYAKKFLGLVQTNVVGPKGFNFQARIYSAPQQPDKVANDAVEAAWDRWCAKGVCDVSGKLDFRGICVQAIRTAARDGEFLIRKIRGADAGNDFGFALQLLDPARIESRLNRNGGEGVNAIRMGVEVNKFGRPVAYHLRSTNQGDSYITMTLAPRAQDTLRIPAEDIIHGFIAEWPEQVRGVPWMHAAMTRLNHLGGYEESAIIASRVGASNMGVFVRKDEAAETEQEAVASQATGYDAEGNALTDADPGTFQFAPDGYDLQKFDPDYPSAVFDPFMKACLRGVSSGLEVAYHSLGNDLTSVSFSSIRSGTLEDRDRWMLLQAWLISELCEPAHGEVLKNGLAFGQITTANGSALPLSKREKFSAHRFVGRRWDWVDPRNDMDAKRMALAMNMTSPQRVAQEMLGVDYEDLLIEISEARALEAQLNVAPPDLSAGANQQQAGPAQAQADQAAQADQSARATAQAIAEREHAAAESAQRHAEVLAALASAKPAPTNFSLSIPELRVPEIPPAIINIPEIRLPEMPAPIVNVTVPQRDITVPAPVVNVTVQPADVQLEAQLSMPARKSESTIERDAQGNVTRTTTVETDA